MDRAELIRTVAYGVLAYLLVDLSRPLPLTLGGS